MKNYIRKFVSIIVLSVMTVSLLAGCYDRAACSDVISVADQFSAALIDGDIDTLIELTDEKTTLAKSRPYLSKLNFGKTYLQDKCQVLELIHDTMDYYVEPGSADAAFKDEQGTVDVYFEMVDYESVLEDPDNKTDLDKLLNKLDREKDITTIRVSLNFVYEDNEWKVTNLRDTFNTVYAFLEVNVSFPIPAEDVITGATWIFCDEDTPGIYESATELDLQLDLDRSMGRVDDSEIYYTVTCNGETLYISPDGSTDGIYGEEQEAVRNQYGFIPVGDYEISFYNGEGELIYSDTAHVTFDEPQED